MYTYAAYTDTHFLWRTSSPPGGLAPHDLLAPSGYAALPRPRRGPCLPGLSVHSPFVMGQLSSAQYNRWSLKAGLMID